jgi:30S ribosomal protein S31
MGRGDKKSKKGKIFKGSFGKSRPARTKKKAAKKAGK